MMSYLLGLNARHRRAGRMLAALSLAGLSAALLSAGLAAGQATTAKTASPPASRGSRTFHVEEATIADVHRAILQGDTTCKAIVQSYIERARAYDGACVQLVTRDGASIPAVAGMTRVGSTVAFPTSTTAIGSMLPKFDEYVGPPHRVRADGDHELGSGRLSAVRHGHRHPERRAGERAQHAEHSRRTFGVLQGRVRRRALVRPAAGELSEGVRRVSEAAGRARTRRRSSTRTTAGSPT